MCSFPFTVTLRDLLQQHLQNVVARNINFLNNISCNNNLGAHILLKIETLGCYVQAT